MEIPLKLIELENKYPFWNISVILFIIGYAFFNLPDLFITDHFGDYEKWVIPILNKCGDLNSLFELRGFLQWELICISKDLGNEKLLPFVSSLVLLGLTYLISKKFTGSKLLGVISLLIVSASGNFFLFDSSSTYPQFWALFFLLSFYFAYSNKLYFLSPIFLGLAFLSKPLAFLYLPIILIAIYDSGISKYSKAIQYLSISILIALTLIRYSSIYIGGSQDYNQDELIFGLSKWFFLLDSSLIIAMSIPIVVFQLGKRLRKKEHYTKTIFYSILIIIMLIPLIDGFTDQINHPHRFVPLVVFVSVGISLTIENSLNFLIKRNKKFNFISNKEKQN